MEKGNKSWTTMILTRVKEALSQALRDTVFEFDETDDLLDSWKIVFNGVLDEIWSWGERRVKRAVQAPWMSNSVLKLLYLRDNCLKTAKRFTDAVDWSNYRAARNKASSRIRSSKRNFLSEAFGENKGNSRSTKTDWLSGPFLESPKTLSVPKSRSLNFGSLSL